MINIINKQRSVPLNRKELESLIGKILSIIDYEDFDIGILFTTNTTIQDYNRTYREKNKPTDILSFAYHPHKKPEERIAVITEDDKNLGDLILSPAYIKKDAQALGASFQERLTILLIHGICHLLGYDHEEDVDWELMKIEEKRILDALRQP